MRYKELVEDTPDDRLRQKVQSKFKQIEQDCQPFLKMINYDVPNNALYRGMDNPGIVGTKKARLDNREPMSSDLEDHQLLNNYFTQKYGHPFRNGVFATGDFPEASSYGEVVAIFPIGNFEFIWHKNISDLFTGVLDPNRVNGYENWSTFAKSKDAGIPIDVNNKQPIMDWAEKHSPTDLLDFMGPYKLNRNLIDGIKSKNEIMVWTRAYHYVGWDYLDLWGTQDEI